MKLAQANLNLAKATAARFNALLDSHAVSQQDVDTQNAAEKVQEANVSGALAFESGIQKMEDFKQVRAPFDGIVTARHIDVGDFVSATGQTGSPGTTQTRTGTPNQDLFRIAQTGTLRVYVNVPEAYADATRPRRESQRRHRLKPRTSRPSARSCARRARSTRIHSRCSARSTCPTPTVSCCPAATRRSISTSRRPTPPMVIPGNALIFRQQGPQVGVVGPDGVVKLKDIKISRDLGTKLEISQGLDPDDQVIVNPSDSLTDGQQVQVKQQDQEPKKA